jgi:uncharacterized protein YdeI (YjbR/CyaY-like superfamily)
LEAVDEQIVLSYMKEALDNQKKGMEVKAEKTKEVVIPELLLSEFKKDTKLRKAFNALSPYKQKEFSEHISEAKQEKTKLRRLEKIIPMIIEGVGLNDGYR